MGQESQTGRALREKEYKRRTAAVSGAVCTSLLFESRQSESFESTNMSNARPYSGLPSYFSETQWATLYAISEAVIPVLSKEEEEALVASVGPGKDLEAVREYARTGATIDNVAFRGRMNELFETGLLPKQRGDIGLVLNLLRYVHDPYRLYHQFTDRI